MECPLATPSSSSESSTNLLSPLNPEITENECDRASDSGLTTASSNSGDNNFCSAVSPVAAAAAPAGLVGATIDISRMRFECRWNSCGKVFRRPSDLTASMRGTTSRSIAATRPAATRPLPRKRTSSGTRRRTRRLTATAPGTGAASPGAERPRRGMCTTGVTTLSGTSGRSTWAWSLTSERRLR
ncbi:zinc finger protein [Colletotrichum chrysophilum]|uniref:Zinc finger protein n=1 Tax=Colletotrichum chrysophilum TaxID=1836956 RepID=A0AAD8ZZ52_9PEZI|nr:zinc finger protein [Colletotrichum chrysophilum]